MTGFYWTNLEPIWRSLHTFQSRIESSVVPHSAFVSDLFENVSRKQLSSLPDYPHCDCWIDDKLNRLYLEFALAGYPQDNIKVNASKNQLRVKVDSVPPRGTGGAAIHNGISRKDIDFSLSIDEAFKLSEAVTSFQEGLLKIEIPRAEEAEVIDLM
jgi:HSP20 family molecular chaperone IbpA